MSAQETHPSITLSISKADLAQLPPADYFGNIHLIDSIEKVDDAVAALRNSAIIGFDTETRPSFKKGQSHQVALLQLSNHTECFLFRLNKIGLPESVKNILEDESLLKIGVSLHDDFHNLHRIYTLNPSGFIDLQPFVKQFGIVDNSLSRIYGILFDRRISKGQRLTNWEADRLTPQQQAYAAFDALSCIQIYEYLQSGQFNPYDSKYIVVPELPSTENTVDNIDSPDTADEASQAL